MPNARRERQTRTRSRAEPLDVFHTPPEAALRLGVGPVRSPRRTATPRPFVPGRHDRRIVAGVAILLIAMIVTSFVFWFLILQEDAARRAFFPRADSALALALPAAVGAVLQVLVPLFVLRRLQETNRVLVAWSLRLVLGWTASAVLTFLVYATTSYVAARFCLFAMLLIPASWILLRFVRAAVASDRRAGAPA